MGRWLGCCGQGAELVLLRLLYLARLGRRAARDLEGPVTGDSGEEGPLHPPRYPVPMLALARLPLNRVFPSWTL